MHFTRRPAVITALGTTQTLAWASSYYLPAMLAAPMARDLGISTAMVFAAFSAALVVSAFRGPYSGRAIDCWGGRPVLMATNVVFAAGLATLATAASTAWIAGWALIGIGMGSGLYAARQMTRPASNMPQSGCASTCSSFPKSWFQPYFAPWKACS
jgi:MFS family permease